MNEKKKLLSHRVIEVSAEFSNSIQASLSPLVCALFRVSLLSLGRKIFLACFNMNFMRRLLINRMLESFSQLPLLSLARRVYSPVFTVQITDQPEKIQTDSDRIF